VRPQVVRVSVRFLVTLPIGFLFLLLAPSNLLARTVTAAWDPNTDGVTVGYVLSWGTSSGNYGLSVDVGNATTRVVDLLPGGTYYFTVHAYDSAGRRSPNSPEVSITIPNRPPSLANPGDQQNTPGDRVSLQLNATDPDGDALTFLATGLPPGLSIDPTSGVISGALSLTTFGNYCVVASASDGNLTNLKPFRWSV
jgi:hypothetical protein